MADLMGLPQLRRFRGGSSGSGGSVPPPTDGDGGPTTPPPDGTLVSAAWSDTVVEIPGANLHLGFFGSNDFYFQSYGTASANAAMVAKLRYIGFRHVRDVVNVPSATQYRPRLSYVAANAGVDFCLTIAATDYVTSTGAKDISAAIAEVKDHHMDWTEAVGGINEPNNQSVNTNWFTAVKAEQLKLWNAFKGKVKVLAPPMAYNGTNVWTHDFSDVCDTGDVHPYPGGYKPSNQLQYFIDKSKTQNGSSYPVWATEAGYNTATAWKGGNPGVSEAVQAAYEPVVIMEMAIRGVQRSYKYELGDILTNSAKDLRERNWGLFRFDGTAKPAADAMRNFITLMSDPGDSYTPDPLSLSVTGPADMKYRLYGKRNGQYLLVTWRDIQGYTPWHKNSSGVYVGGTTDAVTTQSVSIQLAKSTPIAIYQPHVSSSPVASVTGATASVNVGIGLNIFQIG